MREQDLGQLKIRLGEIKSMGWVKNRRPGNVGGVGNTLEDLLNVEENNLRLPDFGTWELKSQRSRTDALLTLFHSEPEPRAAGVVARVLLPWYGWPHKQAGGRYPAGGRSFRQTINTLAYSDRGFTVDVDYDMQRVFVSFDWTMVDGRHAHWLEGVKAAAGTGSIEPQPYWDFECIDETLGTKLRNLMYVRADTKRENGAEYFKYNELEAYVDPTLENFLNLLERGEIFVDFDARTGHNHGTKFRIKQGAKTHLYERHIRV